jgi:hypothetical protein
MSDSHLPCHTHSIPDHAVLLKATAQHGRREGLWANCPHSASSGYHVEFHEVIRRIPISDAGDQCETKHRLSWTRKRVVATHYKKDDLLHCFDISGYHAGFHEGHSTVGAGQGGGMACELTHGLAWERHAMCESAFIQYMHLEF